MRFYQRASYNESFLVYFRNGQTTTSSGTSPSLAGWRICGSRRANSGSRMFSCTTGKHVRFALTPTIQAVHSSPIDDEMLLNNHLDFKEKIAKPYKTCSSSTGLECIYIKKKKKRKEIRRKNVRLIQAFHFDDPIYHVDIWNWELNKLTIILSVKELVAHRL